MYGQRPVESDEEARLADVLAGEAGQQRPQADREGGGVAEQFGLVLVAADHNQEKKEILLSTFNI